ncbi:transporter suffix domain-containing protein [Sunxiuqinia sp. sy24]|uniref:transporter suffix domain-containing protein n=1 Tax=Sunxiuqinia sp. sy24 TaxID=3461495 RepID=UPI0040456796
MKKKNFKWGIFLMIFSGVFFALTLLIPFLELETKQKVVWSSASFIAMEVVFWLGGLLVGKELFTKYKARLNPGNWFQKKTSEEE